MTLQTGRSKSRAGRLHGATGFSLIELSLVVVILLVIISLANPTLKKTFAGFTLKDSAFTLVQWMRYAQERAVIEHKSYKVKFDTEQNACQLLERSSAAKPGEPPYVPVKGKTGRPYRLPRGITLSAQPREMIFYSDGRTDPVVLEISDAYGSRFLIKTRGMMGRFEVKEGEGA